MMRVLAILVLATVGLAAAASAPQQTIAIAADPASGSFLVDGVANADVALYGGSASSTYTFNINSPNDPFWIKTAPCAPFFPRKW